MTNVVEAVELQFVKLNKLLQIETEMCNSLELQLSEIVKSTSNIEENNKLKCSMEERSAQRNVQCLENNTCSLRASLETTTVLINELRKLAELQNFESRRKELVTNLEMYENEWKTLEETYNLLPIANDINILKKQRKQNNLRKMLKCKELTDMKSMISSYRKVKGKRTQSLIVELILSLKKGRSQFAKNLHLKEKTRCFAAEIGKLRKEISLRGNMSNIMCHHPFLRPKSVSGFAVPTPYSMLEKKSRVMDVNHTCQISPTDVSSFKLPQLMVPAFNYPFNKNLGNVPARNCNQQAHTSENYVGESTLDDCVPNIEKRPAVLCSNVNKNLNSPLVSVSESCSTSNIVNLPNHCKNRLINDTENIYKQPLETNKNESEEIIYIASKPLQSTSEKSPIKVLNDSEQLVKHIIPTSGPSTSGYNTTGKSLRNNLQEFQYAPANTSTSDGFLSFNFDSSARPKSNLWDIFN